jgi:hypothetical protein
VEERVIEKRKMRSSKATLHPQPLTLLLYLQDAQIQIVETLPLGIIKALTEFPVTIRTPHPPSSQ